MSRKPIRVHKDSNSTQANDQLHKPSKHIEETARLASSVEPNKEIERVRKAQHLGAVPPCTTGSATLLKPD
jgi:hypothetical protein